MTAEQMAAQILKTVKERPSATFVEILNDCGAEAEGELEMGLPNRPHLIIWAGVSRLFIDAFNSIKDQIVPSPSNIMVYAYDGLPTHMIENYELAEDNGMSFDHTKQYWLPVVFKIKKANEAKSGARK